MRATNYIRLAGVIWVALAAVKALRPQILAAYFASTMDLPHWGALATAWFVILMEGALGCALVFIAPRRFAALLGFTSIFLAGLLVAASMLVRQPEACGCFGGIIKATTSRRVVIAASIAFVSAIGLRSRTEADECE